LHQLVFPRGEWQNYQLHLLASDADVNDVVSMSAFGESFGLTISASTFGYVPTLNGNEIEGTFAWTPDMSQVRPNPYLVVLRTSDGFFCYDETVQVEVTLTTTDVEELDAFKVREIYPNPASNSFTLPLRLDKGQRITMDIYNILGVKVYQSGEMNFTAGNHLILKNIDLNSGQYLVSIKDNSGNMLSTERIVVVK